MFYIEIPFEKVIKCFIIFEVADTDADKLLIPMSAELWSRSTDSEYFHIDPSQF